MKVSAEISALQQRLNYQFTRPELLRQAVTHASFKAAQGDDNQRLEFLGDRVLGLIMAEALLARDLDASEGQLAPRFNALVRKETCADIARALDLGAAMKLGRSEMLSGGRRKQALLGDAMEAVIAAIYLDGGLDAARDFILRQWKTAMAQVKTDARDAKTSLQEWAQARGQTPPKYVLINRSGPDHAPQFLVEAQLQNGPTARAEAASKKAAEHQAAALLLAEVEGK